MTGARNTLLYQDLGLVLQAFQHDKIPVIVLKGAHLAALVYRHIALRPMSDIDLLVHRSDLERAVAKLHDLGFTGPLPGEVPMVSQEGHHLPMMHKAPETGIEVHWAPFWPPRLAGIANDACWARSCPATIAGAPTRVLSPEDLLLHVCLHDACDLACGPFGLGLRPLCDVAAIIRHYRETLSWPEGGAPLGVAPRGWALLVLPDPGTGLAWQGQRLGVATRRPSPPNVRLRPAGPRARSSLELALLLSRTHAEGNHRWTQINTDSAGQGLGWVHLACGHYPVRRFSTWESRSRSDSHLC